MHAHVMITSDLLHQIGLPALLDACVCLTPQGKRLKNEVRFFDPDARHALERELSAVYRLTVLIQEKQPVLVEALTQLARLRELRGTLSRLDKGGLLDDTEFFELKGALTIFGKLEKLRLLLQAADVWFEDTSGAFTLLNPVGKNTPSFHIYSEYSQQLEEIRARKKELERQISQSDHASRAALLAQRALVVDEEGREEEQIRRQLGARLKEWLPQIRHNAEACAVLDFRLAKADLAVRWGGSLPVLMEGATPMIVQGALHPQVAAHLERQGQKFTPISVEVQPGTTVLSGANMGGKSVALKTVFLAQLMTQLGYFPVCESLRTSLFDFLAFESRQDGDLERGLSSFGLEAVRIRDHFRRSRSHRGFIVMDEPCRGTNPAEATAIVRALCQSYGTSKSSLLIATHYQVTPKPGIRFYQVRGIRSEALAQLSSHLARTTSTEKHQEDVAAGVVGFSTSDTREDLTRIRRIQNLMDYQLEEIDGNHQVPSGAIRIAELLGVDEVLLREMRAAWQEEEWQSLD